MSGRFNHLTACGMQTHKCHEQSSLLRNVNEQAEIFHGVCPALTFTSITKLKQQTVAINASQLL